MRLSRRWGTQLVVGQTSGYPLYNTQMESLKSWKTWKFLLIAALVDWFLIHLLDSLKTGTATLAGKLLGVVTLGSHTIRDAPYAAASLNPYPLPGALLVLAIMFATFPWVTRRAWSSLLPESKELFRRLVSSITKKRTDLSGLDSPRKKSQAETINFLVVLFVLVGLELFTIGSAITLQAIEIRQSFDADLDIVAPYITPQQILESRSQFAQITTQQQFRELMARFIVLADAHHVKLRDPNV